MINPFVIMGIVLIIMAIMLAVFSHFNPQYVIGAKYDCDKTVYNTTLGLDYLRNITAFCSDGN